MSALSSASATSMLVPGYRLDRYELLAPIAEGGFGQVWLARLRGKRGFEKLVAIKVPKLSGDVHFQEMLLDEARIAAAIEHDNVGKILELGEQGELLYIVMEWIDGEPVATLLRTLDKKKTRFPLPIALRIILDMCAGTHAAHELCGADGMPLNVVHRDVSPQNMLITASGNVKLIDFGIAKARDRASGDTTDGTLKGKVKYMAPEQALGANIDRRADIFALGAVLHRFLSGRAPFEAENEIATLHKLAQSAAPHPLPDDIPPAIQSVIFKALALKVDERFNTALEMHTALTEAMTSLAIVATPANVSSFTEEHLTERLARRRAAVDAAIKAAAERASSAALAIPTPLLAFPVPLSSESFVGAASSASSNSNSSESAGVSSNSNISISHNSNNSINSAPHSGPSGYGHSGHSQSGDSYASGSSSIGSGQQMFALDVGVHPSGQTDEMASELRPSSRGKVRWLWGVALIVGMLGVGLITLVAVRRTTTPAATVTGATTTSSSPTPSATSAIETPSVPPSVEQVPTIAVATSSSAVASASAAPSASIAQRPPPPPPFIPRNGGGKIVRPKPTTDFGY